jgi:tRNA A-37 threonylcarbamoyl transferase component Bud32
MRTQRYVYNAFKQMANASASGVKAPEIYHAFECENKNYIVMEHFVGETVSALLRDCSSENRHWI